MASHPQRGHARFLAAVATGLTMGIGTYVGVALLLVTPESRLLYQTTDMWRLKLQRLDVPDRPPHLVIISASNGLYSIDSATLAANIGRPVTNAAMQGNFTMPMLEDVAARVRPGDWIFLPLEWGFWETPVVRTPMEACYNLAHRRSMLKTLGDWAKVLTSCNPKILLMGARQRLTRMAGMEFEPSGMEQLITPEGDIRENTPETATAERTVQRTDTLISDAPTLSPPLQLPRIEGAVRTIQQRGGTVIASWPVHAKVVPGQYTRYQADIGPDHPTPAAVREWASRHGVAVVSDPRDHEFPLSCLWDNGYHLHQGCSPENARRYGLAIRRWAEQAGQ